MKKFLFTLVIVLSFATVFTFAQKSEVQSYKFLNDLQLKYQDYLSNAENVVTDFQFKRWYSATPTGEPLEKQAYQIRYRGQKGEEFIPYPGSHDINKQKGAGLGGNSGAYISKIAETFLTLKFRPEKFVYLKSRTWRNEDNPLDTTYKRVDVYQFKLSLEESNQGVVMKEGLIPRLNWFISTPCEFGYSGEVYIESGTQKIRYFSMVSSPDDKDWSRRKFDYYKCRIWLDDCLIAGTKQTMLLPVKATEEVKVAGRSEYGYNLKTYSGYRQFKVEAKEVIEP